MSTKTATKPKGIIFTAESVRAILDGRKTQTRRVVKPQPDFTYTVVEDGKYSRMDDCGDWHEWSPHKPGDVVYVKETWQTVNPLAGCEFNGRPENDGVRYRATWTKSHHQGWRSPLMMPRWAARIWLRIVAVRCERVQDISEPDAIAEGTQMPFGSLPKAIRQAAFSERTIYARLFDHINGKGTWESNPWVWVYTFEKTEKPE